MQSSKNSTDTGLMPGIVSIFSSMLIAIEVAEFSTHIPSAIGGITEYWLMRFTPWLLSILTATIIWWSGKLGKVGVLAGIAGSGLAFVVLTSYRGTYIWPGIFDLVSLPGGELKIAYLLGIIGGGITLVIPPKPRQSPGRTSDITLLASLAVLGLVEWWCSIQFPIASQFAPLRHVAILVLVAVFGVFLVISEVQMA